jgi:hypothetical protein
MHTGSQQALAVEPELMSCLSRGHLSIVGKREGRYDEDGAPITGGDETLA